MTQYTVPHIRAERHHRAGVHKTRRMGRVARLVATVALFATVTGCAPRYIPVNHYIETERIKVERDSVTLSDTVRIAERGDTVLVEVTKWRTRCRTTTDTLRRVDTVQLPPEVITQAAPRKSPAKRWTNLLATLLGVIAVVCIIRVLYR